MDNNQYPTQPVETPVQPAYTEQPAYAQQPVYVQQQPAAPAVSRGGKVLSIIAMVCGIVAMVFCWYPFLGLFCGIAAIILGAIAKKKGANGMNKTGLILGIIGTVLGAILTIVIIAAAAGTASYSYGYDYYDYYTVFVSNLLK